MNKTRLVIISGISGSGKSTVLNAFEDMGFYCVDNLPVPLLAHFADFLCGSSVPGVPETEAIPLGAWISSKLFALLINLDEQRSFLHVQGAVERMRAAGVEVSLLFLDCQDEVIIRRYSETRRPHPLLVGTHSSLTIEEALAKERELLSNVREAATRVIDTTSYTPHGLRQVVEEYCQHHNHLEITLVSFGYKYGLPHDADLVVDVRFLANPYFVRALRPLTGLEKSVADYVFQSQDAEEFVCRYLHLLEYLIPKYQEEGKHYLTIGIGCTGGRHRSIALTMRIKSELEARGFYLTVRHRDINRI
jgi:RNase adapter protein RapZ